MDSHILPKWMYRRAREGGDGGDPVMISNGVAIQTSTQLREHLLCDACEQRFAKDENCVSRLAYKADGTLGLLDQVSQETVFITKNEPFQIRGAPIADLDCQAIARFAASIFWRSRVRRGFKESEYRLLQEHADHLRLFLMGEKPLPPRMCIYMFVLADDGTFSSAHSGTACLPTTGENGSDAMHWFATFGLVFVLKMENDLPHVCVACDPAPHAALATWEAFKFLNTLTQDMVGSTRKGKFARVPLK